MKSKHLSSNKLQTLGNWEYLCDLIKDCGGGRYTVSEYLGMDSREPTILIKHDVEDSLGNALLIARIEKDAGVKATYYFQVEIFESNPAIVDEIKNCGHEIAYHYDVLDQCSGDIQLAMECFEKAIATFRKHGHDIATVCPHGNPLLIRHGWNSNKDFFRNPLVREKYFNIYDIAVDSLRLFGQDFTYISDAGYSWKKISCVSENDRGDFPDVKIGNVFNFVKARVETIIISSHPHRWLRSSLRAYLKQNLFFSLRWCARILKKNDFLHATMGRFYYLARKF